MNENQKLTPIEWEAPEFQEYKKHPLWFLGLAVVVALFILYAIVNRSWSMAVTFGLLGILGFFYAAQKPKLHHIALTGVGIEVNDMIYNYRVIKKFWVIYSPPEVKTLYLETDSVLNHIVKLELGNQDPRPVREFLKEYLPEDLEEEESMADIIARRLKF